jgi:hypothetical protein
VLEPTESRQKVTTTSSSNRENKKNDHLQQRHHQHQQQPFLVNSTMPVLDSGHSERHEHIGRAGESEWSYWMMWWRQQNRKQLLSHRCATYTCQINSSNQNKHDNTIKHTPLMTASMVGGWSRAMVMVVHLLFPSSTIMLAPSLLFHHTSSFTCLTHLSLHPWGLPSVSERETASFIHSSSCSGAPASNQQFRPIMVHNRMNC